MNKKFISSILVASSMLVSSAVFADQSKGLNVLLTAAERQAQMMAMVLSVQTIKKHGKEVNMVLCGSAGDLALSSTKTEAMKPPGKSPTQLLHALLKMGASVEVCPLYLPDVGKSKDDLIQGITIAKPSVVAGRLLDTDYTNLSY
jgi:predicted peroxiredoxin